HGLLPDRAGQGAPVDDSVVSAPDGHVLEWILLPTTCVTDDHGRGQMRRVADEPGVCGTVRGAGLARHRTSRAQPVGRTPLERLLQQVVDAVGDLGVDRVLVTVASDLDLLGVLVIGGSGEDRGDRVRFAAGPTRGEDGVGVGHGQRRHLLVTEDEGTPHAQVFTVGPVDARVLGHLDGLAQADPALQLGEVGVHRALGGTDHVVGAFVALSGVAHAPGGHRPAFAVAHPADRHLLGRVEGSAVTTSGLQGGGQRVDLEGRSGLKTGRSPVVLVHGHVDRGGAGFLVVEAVSQVLSQGPYAAVAGGHDRLSGELRALFRWYVLVDGLLRRFLSGPTQAGTYGQAAPFDGLRTFFG